jgi:hypothetical protein
MGEAGGLRATMVGAVWPVAAWFPAVQNPQRCSHHRHVLEHARVMEEIRVIEQLKKERR